MKIILYGLALDDFFGSRSILHGMIEQIRRNCGERTEIIYYNYGHTSVSVQKEFGLRFKNYESSAMRLLFGALAYRLGFRSRFITGSLASFLEDISEADRVINLKGILFCENLLQNMSKLRAFRSEFKHLILPFACKILGTIVVKNTCSFGPIERPETKWAARISCESLFEVVLAREHASRLALLGAKVGKNVMVSPDTAILMQTEGRKGDLSSNPVGISVSHQIIKQWQSHESYIECIVTLCKHIWNESGKSILLIPNECRPLSGVSDIEVAEEILNKLETSSASILNARNLSALEVKGAIASCEVLIASRYHSCVAALSSGVPVLVIGWHSKYKELLTLYSQEKWILSNRDCSSLALLKMFDELWRARQECSKVIQDRRSIVVDAVYEKGRTLLGV